MHVTKWGEYGILCSVFLARRYAAAVKAQASSSASKTHSSTVSGVPDELLDPVGALEVAEQQGIPAQYTQQILQRLRRGGIVKSVRGAHGGYVLSRAPSEITLLDVMKAAEGSTFDVMCETSPAYPSEGEPTSCNSSSMVGGCNLKEVWFEVRSAIDAVLSRRTLESLVTEATANNSTLVQIAPGTATRATAI